MSDLWIASCILLAAALAAGAAAAGCAEVPDERATCEDLAERLCECDDWGDVAACEDSQAGGCDGGGELYQDCALECDLLLSCDDYEACTSSCWP